MKIAISSLGENLEAQVDPRFGRCQNIIFFDTETENFESVKNENVMAGGGAGIKTAQLVIDNNSEVLLSGNFGPNAFRTLSAGDVKVFGNVTGTVKEAIENYKAGKLKEMKSETVGSHNGMR